MQTKVFNDQPENKPLWLRNFVSIYQTLTISNLDLLAHIYHVDVTFIDPMHKVEGIDELIKYFESLYQNIASCRFEIDHVITEKHEASIYWKMTYQHTKLNKGKDVTVYGNSHIKGQNDKVIYHRDYLDLGEMLYEQVPIFGKLTKWIKNKAAN
ncbi:nuclear transport factor 2 family protein [Thalassotalea castellviae]|uniref:Nuclear transport factor 2 family protein n=1 Tax=Thalassotalea castellviae TaxID=3075612 RepID=A0ABU3A2D2_9GAMM|nr:nuclear transport factor 2 family protein [Thalassotalea sp. W431]MDT0604341.1 nuclear transport factor 2 family protein [Thalassotalea sp. W431]